MVGSWLRSAVLGVAAGLAGARLRRRWRAPGEAPSGRAEDVPDDVLIARVRQQAAVPEGVEVAVVDGALVLFGRVARHALSPLLERVARVGGVSVVENRLTPSDEPYHEQA